MKKASTTPPESSIAGTRDSSGVSGEFVALLPYLGIVVALWAFAIWFVDPIGDFSVNDDWSFVQSLSALKQEGRIIRTGWGMGGPSLVAHLAWAYLFTEVMGSESLTALRCSVLTLGVVGSIGFLVLLRMIGAPRWLALLGALTLILNPFYLSQSFTFMTDVTFAATVVFSVMFLCLGVEKARLWLVAVGLIFALSGILTRQIGVVVPLGFLLAALVSPEARSLGFIRLVALTIVITILPWLGYEWFLQSVGSSPVYKHKMIQSIFERPFLVGGWVYAQQLWSCFAFSSCYLGLLLSPILWLRLPDVAERRAFKIWVAAITVGLIVAQAVIMTHWADMPMRIWKNVVFNAGIGPILLKDTFVLGIRRVPRIPPWLYYVLLYLALVGVGIGFTLAITALKDILRRVRFPYEARGGFAGIFALLAGLAYMGVIVLSGFFDRYLIIPCVFFTIWLAAGWTTTRRERVKPVIMGLALLTLLMFGAFSIPALRDFMELKRAQTRAQHYLLSDLGERPCEVDGGFEFNGYHCYHREYRPRRGLSWWWVGREDYLLALGPLPGYRVKRVFPFTRYIGPDGAIFVLEPIAKIEPGNKSGNPKRENPG